MTHTVLTTLPPARAAMSDAQATALKEVLPKVCAKACAARLCSALHRPLLQALSTIVDADCQLTPM